MKFLMVMIICFAEDTCQAVFDAAQFNTYDECMAQALPVSRYMRDVYTTSAGEILHTTSFGSMFRNIFCIVDLPFAAL